MNTLEESIGRMVRATCTLWIVGSWMLGGPVSAQNIRAIVGGTLIDGLGGPPIADGVVLIRGAQIACAGARAACPIPAHAGRINARGMWITPGLIDAHVHFSQTGWFDGRPDAVDLRDRFPYPEVVADLEARPERFLRAYTCSGVTSVFDVGGYPWTWSLRRRFASDPGAPRIVAAGPLLATVDHWLNVPGQRQFIYMVSDSGVREAVRTHAAFKSDAVKIWYIMPPEPPDTARVQRLVRAVVDEANAHHLPVIVHATGLWEAKDAIRAGARVLVHSVFESPIDSEFIALAQQHRIILVPTLMVDGEYVNVARYGLDSLGYPLECADTETIARIRATPIPPERMAGFLRPEALELSDRELATAMDNAKRLVAAGVPLAVGSDAGNPGTFHGPAIYREMELMQEAGLSPMAVLVAATRTAALALEREDSVGVIAKGMAADVLLLGADPTADIRNVRRIRSVMKAGVVWRP